MSDSVPRRHTGPTWVEVTLDSCREIADWYHRRTRNQRDVLLACAAVTFAVLGTLAFVWYSTPIAPQPRGATPNLAGGVTGSPPESSPSGTKPPESGQGNRDEQAGYTVGRELGREWATKDFGVPHGIGFDAIANARFETAGATDLEAFRSGFRKGFDDGYGSVKPLPDVKGLRPLAWANLTAGTPIYDWTGRYTAALVRVDRRAGLIYVRYPEGSVEPKRVDALQPYWFTH